MAAFRLQAAKNGDTTRAIKISLRRLSESAASDTKNTKETPEILGCFVVNKIKNV